MKPSKWCIFLCSVFCLCFITVGCRNDDDDDPQAAPTPSNQGQYSTSANCRECHQAIYAQWEKSGHNKKFQILSKPPGVICDANSNGIDDFKDFRDLGNPTNSPLDADWSNYFTAGSSPRLNFNATTGNYEIIIAGNVYNIAYTIGGHRWKQRYVTKIGNSLYTLPLQFFMSTEQRGTDNLLPEQEIASDDRAGKQEWTTYNASDWYSGTTFIGRSLSKAWEKKCLYCHSTGTSNLQQNSNGEWTASFTERSITCEACHGPSAEHVAKGGGIGTTINPSKLSVARANELCGSCHSRGKSRKGETFNKNTDPSGSFDFPWSLANAPYTPGQVLSDYYTFEKFGSTEVWPDTYDTAKAHHQQFMDFRYDKHLQYGLTCWTCHDPHGNGNRSDLKGDPNRNDLCLDCHGLGKEYEMSNIDQTTGSIQNHTYHNVDPISPDQPTVGNGSLCSNCHYPFTAKSGAVYDVRAHTAKIVYPVESSKFLVSGSRMPNSCMNGYCHTSKDISSNKWAITSDANLNTATSYIGNSDASTHVDGHFNAGGILGNVSPRAHISVKETNTSGTKAIYFSLSGSSGLATPNICLDGNTSYDPNRDVAAATGLTYTWTQLLGKQDVSASLTGVAPMFTIAGSANVGEYRFQLVVQDANGRQSDVYKVSLYVRP